MNDPGDARRGVLIPSYNTGPLLLETVQTVLAAWRPVLVVIDGSDDGSDEAVVALSRTEPGLQVLRRTANGGKGAAVLEGLGVAADQGWTHAATFDADGQHEAADVPLLMRASQQRPEALILGEPVYGDDAPRLRVLGHRLANFFAKLETLDPRLGDSLCGFRVYPVLPALKVMESIRGARGFDLETQLVVRLSWAGLPAVRIPTRIRYRTAGSGGVSHFRYGRDNLLLARVHATLLLLATTKLPGILARRL